MSTIHSRAVQRNRALRAKADENATGRHARQASSTSGIPVAGASRVPIAMAPAATKSHLARAALGEVTIPANRKKDAKGKLVDTGLKRSRSSSLAAATGPQRVPLGPGRSAASTTTSRLPTSRTQAQRIPVFKQEEVPEVEINLNVNNEEMDVETEPEDVEPVLAAMSGVESSEEEDDEEPEPEQDNAQPKGPLVWPEVSAERALRYQKQVEAIKSAFDDQIDAFDTTMVSEYSDEIFEYMCELETEMMPSADYMSHQNEITWPMRQTLVDWLLQVHLRYHMLPETLWIAVNIVDRFLTKRVVSLVKLQLVGVTAMFTAAKYEEILAPSVDEFVFMTENGYNKEEILKGERIMLQTLDFRISHYCSPYSWMRRISKADDYDIQTRTLSKFLTEVTLLDYRFLRVKPSLVAAVGMYVARKMLTGEWNDAFIFYSGYTEEQLIPGHNLLVEKLTEANFSRQYVCKKYANKKFLKASTFAIEWAKMQVEGEGNNGNVIGGSMMLEG